MLVIAPSASSIRPTSFCSLLPVTFLASNAWSKVSVCKGWRKSWLAAARKRDFGACLLTQLAALPRG